MRSSDTAVNGRPSDGGASQLRIASERSLRAQLTMFCIVGAGNLLVDTVVYAFLVGILGWTGNIEATAASVLGFLAGATNSFAWNSRLTFRGRHHAQARVSLLAGRFLLVAVGGAILAAVASMLVLTLWPFELRFVATKAAAILAAVGWNFTLARSWVFRRHVA